MILQHQYYQGGKTMKTLTDCYKLYNGVEIPCIGFGTWQAPNGNVAVSSVLSALEAGYRHIDTAQMYGNEESVGNAIKKSGISRKKIFITSKLSNSKHGYKNTIEAFEKTVAYVQICSAGAIFIVAYNVLGSVFRGIGNSKTPLFTVFIACIINIIGDLLFVAVFNMGVAGAALATVLAQAVSVILCIIVVKKRGLPFAFSRENIRFNKTAIGCTVKLGFPIALQDGLVSRAKLEVKNEDRY
jgi:hypothetical protein